MNSMSRIGVLVLVSVWSLSAAPFSVMRDSSDRIPVVEVESSIVTYAVVGETRDEVAQALRQLGPRDSELNSRDAYTSWKLRWHWGVTKHGLVDPGLVNIHLSVRMLIPRIETKSVRLLNAWGKFHDLLLSHELRHQSFAIEGAIQIRNNLIAAYKQNGSLTIAQGDLIAKSVLSEIREQDLSYDRLTNHGETEAIRWNINS